MCVLIQTASKKIMPSVLSWMFTFIFLSLFSDKMFPAFGFGAQVPPTMQVHELEIINLKNDSSLIDAT